MPSGIARLMALLPCALLVLAAPWAAAMQPAPAPPRCDPATIRPAITLRQELPDFRGCRPEVAMRWLGLVWEEPPVATEDRPSETIAEGLIDGQSRDPGTPFALIEDGLTLYVSTGPPTPPDESLQVQVESLGDVGEGAPLRFTVSLPNFVGLADLGLTYAVVPGGGDAEPGVDYDEASGPVRFAAGADVGTFEIPTRPNPASGGARLTVAVLHGERIVGRAPGIIVDRPPPRVEVTDTSIEEGGELVFPVAIDPAAEVRGPWTYSYRVEGVSATEGTDYEGRSGSLRFDAQGRPLDEIRIRTWPDEADGTRTLRLVVMAGETEAGSGLGTILNLAPIDEGDPRWPVAPVVILVLVIGLGGAAGIGWRLLRRPRVPGPAPPAPPETATDGREPEPEPEPVAGPFAVKTRPGRAAVEGGEFGLPQLEILAAAGPHRIELPRPLPIEA